MGTVQDLGTRRAGWVQFGAGEPDFAIRLADLLALQDDALLAAYVADSRALSYPRLRSALAAQTGQALVHPVYFGSAITGAGIECLTDGLAELLPTAAGAADDGAVRAAAAMKEPAAGTVFKVERGPAGEKIAYVRMFAGAVHAREHRSPRR